jgi:hypothetical protein
MKRDPIMIREQDNVATALRDMKPQETVTVGIGTKSKLILIHEHMPDGRPFLNLVFNMLCWKEKGDTHVHDASTGYR